MTLDPVKIISPKGVAVWPKLNEPDTYKNATTYNVRLRLDTNDEKVQAFLDQIEEMRQAALPWATADLEDRHSKAKDAAKKGSAAKKLKDLSLADSPVKPVLDEDGNETQFVEVRFKCNAEFKSKDGTMQSGAPRLRDAKKNEIPRTVQIGGGSIIRVSAQMFPYYMESLDQAGISFRLNAVQVLELKQYGGDDGFEEEDGYEADAEEAAKADDF